jgi:hypothetical protein
MPVLNIYLKGWRGEMLTKYLHTEQPNTQSEQYLKRTTNMNMYYINVIMRMRTWSCDKKWASRGPRMKSGPRIVMM